MATRSSGTVNSERPTFEKKLVAGANVTVTYDAVDISPTPTEAQVQAISTALTTLIAQLKARGI